MAKLMIAASLGLALAVGACTEAERRDAGNDAEAAAGKVAAETRDAVNSPELKEMGAEIKEAAGDAGQVIKNAAKGAAEGAREGVAKVEKESEEAAHDPNH
ncbi:MAG: hypothetical protein JNK30_08480 [Phenylobacterium sp.]|uniref:hypothetical protein n=1 Tax=Phenylobacterium sp. TaxID=1871053 RepID=UPI001A49EEC2|nr:hypothetical protein [Phenylobacterium sp.]MBL8771405.1 hypothetical protein [Phenylobacterium sp.]